MEVIRKFIWMEQKLILFNFRKVVLIYLFFSKYITFIIRPLDGSGNICGHPSYRDKWLEIDWGDAAHTSSTLEF